MARNIMARIDRIEQTLGREGRERQESFMRAWFDARDRCLWTAAREVAKSSEEAAPGSANKIREQMIDAVDEEFERRWSEQKEPDKPRNHVNISNKSGRLSRREVMEGFGFLAISGKLEDEMREIIDAVVVGTSKHANPAIAEKLRDELVEAVHRSAAAFKE